MILLDENCNAPLLLQFKNLLCVFWQSLRSNGVLPNSLVSQLQYFNNLYSSKKDNQIDRIPLLSKGNTVSTTIDNYMIVNTQQLLFRNSVYPVALTPTPSKSKFKFKFKFNRYSPFFENKSLLSIPRAGVAFHDINA